MDEHPKVSVIIPVYNNRDYIRKCVNSVLSSDYANMEIILVDDGSGDDSGDICDEYAGREESVTVYHIAHSGASNARNFGLTNSTGSYVMFVDSDDYIESDWIGKMVEKLLSDDSDMVISGFINEEKNESILEVPGIDKGIYKKDDFVLKILENPYADIFKVIWNKIYKADFIKDIIRFKDELEFGEDFVFNIEYVEKINKISIVDFSGYHYIKYNYDAVSNRHKESFLTKENFINYVKQKILIFHYYKELFEHLDIYVENKNKINDYLIKVCVEEIKRIKSSALSNKDKSECILYLKSDSLVRSMKLDVDDFYYFWRKLYYNIMHLKTA
ncbi:Glycosyl transferase family 2 [Acetitomaculum ruminis DSM 5522]|uniref:Glycosyl transferase family 2 n=1 Tax=Acetitomaculum ruminis DSM 5522 TaxID=1120918 RepID=A0A1I0XPR4_9FIRM|nr:glycosyltransferase family 2 protein [Acetitomaculum ruminis]SFB02884.1 Glycosyl transferase family 2 [Acetitomaculum ruminis DSM 5522]